MTPQPAANAPDPGRQDTVTEPKQHGETHDVDALLAESERLFAEHHALSLECREHEETRRAASTEALNAQRAAYAAEDQAWNTYDDAQAKLRTNPSDPDVVAAAEQAWTALDAARTAAHTARERATEIIGRLVDESGRELAQVLQLGERARAAQDAYFAADWKQRRGDDPVFADTTHESAAAARPEPA